MPNSQGNRSVKIARFGIFELNLDVSELRKNGAKVRLQEQPFQVLMLLLGRAGDVVTREDLRQKLWPSDTFVDFDHSLNTAVNKLRETLGDSASSHALYRDSSHAAVTASSPRCKPACRRALRRVRKRQVRKQ